MISQAKQKSKIKQKQTNRLARSFSSKVYFSFPSNCRNTIIIKQENKKKTCLCCCAGVWVEIMFSYVQNGNPSKQQQDKKKIIEGKNKRLVVFSFIFLLSAAAGDGSSDKNSSASLVISSLSAARYITRADLEWWQREVKLLFLVFFFYTTFIARSFFLFFLPSRFWARISLLYEADIHSVEPTDAHPLLVFLLGLRATVCLFFSWTGPTEKRRRGRQLHFFVLFPFFGVIAHTHGGGGYRRVRWKTREKRQIFENRSSFLFPFLFLL